MGKENERATQEHGGCTHELTTHDADKQDTKGVGKQIRSSKLDLRFLLFFHLRLQIKKQTNFVL